MIFFFGNKIKKVLFLRPRIYCSFFSTGQTRALLLSSYIKMINLFPEIKDQIEGVLRSDVLQKNADIELQQRALEYFKVFLFTIFEKKSISINFQLIF